MVTVTAPSSNPTPTYNRSGTTIDFVDGSNNSSSPYQIVRSAGTTVVYLSSVGSNISHRYLMLPSDAEIGDTVEIYPVDVGYAPIVLSPSSATINGLTQGPIGFYRYLADSVWGAVWGIT